MNLNNLLDFAKRYTLRYFDLILLVGIIYFAIILRMTTANTEILLDYDPWWFFRHAQEILDNGLAPLKWDLLSYYPPGRPFDFQLGWPYTIVLSYLVTNFFIPISLMKFSAIFIAVFSGLCAIPAYLAGRFITNRWGGLVTAFFATITPTFLSVSLAGYPDSDTVVVFYTFLAVLSTLYAFKKIHLLQFGNFKNLLNSLIKFLPHIAPALIVYWLFAFNWNTSWYIFYVFAAFVPMLIAFAFLESLVGRNMRIFFDKIKEAKSLLVVIILIAVIGSLITGLTNRWPFNTLPPLDQLLTGSSFLGGGGLIVNVSVAELQPVNVFTREGFLLIANRIGLIPSILAIFGLPAITILKLIYRKKISNAEYFSIIWLIISLWLITRGIRFSLIFSLAMATASGFFVGHLVSFFSDRLKNLLAQSGDTAARGKYLANLLFAAIIFGSIIYGMFSHFSENLQYSSFTGGLEVSGNWREALNWLSANSDENTLIATWWDPGHIITGLTGLKVHADGAHCGIGSCIPYNHNVRISDMGKMFSTSSEDEAYNTLKKYTQLSPKDCNDAKERFSGLIPENACDPIKTVYFIASSDLIGKFTWLNYFGGYTTQPNSPGSCFVEKTNTWIHCFWQFGVSRIERDQTGNPRILYYGSNDLFAVTSQNNQIVAVFGNQQVVRNVVYFQNGQAQVLQYSNVTNTLDGMVWVDPNFGSIIYMDQAVMNSMFTRMFFFSGEGLEKFQLVYQNPELKIFKVSF